MSKKNWGLYITLVLLALNLYILFVSAIEETVANNINVKTTITNPELHIGENKKYSLEIVNNLNKTIYPTLELSGAEIKRFISLEETSLVIEPKEVKTIDILVSINEDEKPAIYDGDLIVKVNETRIITPIRFTIIGAIMAPTELKVNVLTKELESDKTLKAHISIYNPLIRGSNITITYYLKEGGTGKIIYQENELLFLSFSKTLIKEISLDNVTRLMMNDSNITISSGDYFIEVSTVYNNKIISATDTFKIIKPFWSPPRIRFTAYFIISLIALTSSIYSVVYYRKQKKEKARYLFPLSYKELPKKQEDSLWIGKIAETDKKMWFNPDDLVTHVLVAGATGAGKSVAASIFVEELLEKKTPVVIFDPTAQWTGFVRPCKDRNLLNYYKEFGMKEEDTKPFKGLIYEVESPKIDLDFEKYMLPGEVTVFNLSRLKPGEYDQAVKHIVDTIFRIKWEESSKLKMLVVFDEVHRLLEKYGGKGGYIALERACREFRKWGIGLIMASQVNADFKEAVQGNILTEVQLNTKAIEDIKKIEEKYGEEYARRISREGVGIGMMQHPRYNNGKPWFVQFRPTLHSPHKISEEELNIYAEYTNKLKAIGNEIKKVKNRGVDTADLELELKLARGKLKEGRFKMAEIYVTSLEESLKKIDKRWK